MILYKQDGKEFLHIEVDDSSYRFKEIMGDNILVLNFSLPRYIEMETGVYCIFNNEKYTLFLSDNFTKNHSEHYDYTVTFESDMALMRYVKYKFFLTQFDAEQEGINKPKLKFSHTANPKDFAQLIADNMNQSSFEKGWEVDVAGSIDSEPLTLDFNHEDCFSVLTKIAEAFNTEWEVINRTIRIAQVEKNKGSATKLSYGYNKGVLPGISRRQFDSSKVINRLWIQGGDRNIDRTEYGNDTLLLPQNGVIRYDGVKFEDEDGFDENKAIEYKVDQSRSFIERSDNQGIISEDSLDISKIYPMRVSTITEVRTVEDKEGLLYDIIDSNIPDELDYSKSVLPNEKMTVIFQSGILAGKEFEVNYIHKDKKFQIVPKTENGQVYPQYPLIPQALGNPPGYEGDKYAVFHIKLDGVYIKDAEDKAFREAAKYLYDNEQPKYTYDWQLDEIFAKRNAEISGGVLAPGYFIELSDPQFLTQPVDIRITASKEFVNKPLSPQITLSNSVTSKSLGSILKQIPSKDQEIDRSKHEAMEYARRRWKDTQELIDGIAGISDEFKEHLLNALAFEGLIFRAGAASMQFNFYKEDWITPKKPTIEYNNSELYASQANIIHETIEIDGQKPHWMVPELSPGRYGMEADKSYYLYIIASKELEEVDGRMIGEASYLVTEKKIKLDDLEDNYVFWVAFINSENEEQKRSIRTMYSYSEMLPGQVTTDLLVSTDGTSYLDFIDKRFCLKNKYEYSPILHTDSPEIIKDKEENNKKVSGLDWNVTEDDTLTVKGLLNCDEAFIAGLKFYNDRIESEHLIELNGNRYPAIIIKGKSEALPNVSSYIQSNSIIERWKETGGSEKECQSVKMNSDKGGGINISLNNDSVSLSSQGISANRPGVDVITPGANLKSAIAGYANDRMDKQYWGNWGTVGVYGTASNDTPNMAPAYGGWFDFLQVNGMNVSTKRVLNNTFLTKKDTFISIDSPEKTIYLPDDPYTGQVLFISSLRYRTTVHSDNPDYLIYLNNETMMSFYLYANETALLIYDGKYWIVNRLKIQ